MKKALDIAISFGHSLDQDDFSTTLKLLAKDCRYDMGGSILNGPEAIVNSYSENMKEGRAKFDLLEWGKSTVEDLGDGNYEVFFTDFLGHRGIEHIHRCKQRLHVNADLKIVSIDHINLPGEPEKLAAFKQQVGLS